MGGGAKRKDAVYIPGTKPAPVYPNNGKRWLDVLSYGGGLDSFTMLMRSVELGMPPDIIVFSDVADAKHADPGEWPGTYQHIRDVAIPFAAYFKIPFFWITSDINLDIGDAASTKHTVEVVKYLIRHAEENEELGIPAHGPYRSLFARLEHQRRMTLSQQRNCTRWAKTERIDQFLEDRFPEHNIAMWVGFEAGEESRFKSDPYASDYEGGQAIQRERAEGRPRAMYPDARPPSPGTLRLNRYPLMEWDLCRCRSERYIAAKGWPIPRKSACVFCAFNRAEDWPRLAQQLPDVFEKCAQLEDNVALTEDGVKNVWRVTERREWVNPQDAETKKKYGKKPWPKGKKNGPPIREYVRWKLNGGGLTVSAGVCEVCGGPKAEKEPGCGLMPGPASPEPGPNDKHLDFSSEKEDAA
jgi:hypothetical protein